MLYRPRELVIRAREAAALLLGTLDRDEMVERFLDVYAAENRRPGRADQPAHYREQRETIRRESILAMVARIESALPARLKVRVVVKQQTPQRTRGKKKKTKSKTAAHKNPGIEIGIPLLDLFREEFFVALGQALGWREEDAAEFWRDLELYEALTGGGARRAQAGSAKLSIGGPFVDRTAMLLDPSLMEQARRAAAHFQKELFAAADRVLRKSFAARRI
ncbi:MAG TPA: hypothetical protein VMJ93_08455 [Verrucomicrobiae bacterium]|nr:hypothetical protein [Verrucomicrobiae bacterium]